MSQLTPMLRQYTGIKSEYPDAILFFRMGDFYEMFFDDAKVASRVLGITLTARGEHEGEKVPMCGVPYHACKSYIAKLVNNGMKVAICDQVEDPKASKGIVKREVTRVVTPGSVVDEAEVDSKSNLYLASVTGKEGNYGLAYADLSTGEFRVTELGAWKEVIDELARIEAVEVLVPEDKDFSSLPGLENGYQVERLDGQTIDYAEAERVLKVQFEVLSLAGFGCEGMKEGILAAGMLLRYILDNQKGSPGHIKEIISYQRGNFMLLDETTSTHLELLKTMRRQSVKGSLFGVLDKTVTPMGSRLLKKWITYPLIDVERIRKRLEAVSALKEDAVFREETVEELKGIYDLERLNGRTALGRANARDLLALKASIYRIPFIKERLRGSFSTLLSGIAEDLDTLEDVAWIIEEAIHEEPPVSLKEGGLIKEGYDDELDRLVVLSRKGKSWITEFAASEQRRTGISSLKVGFNKVYGYYIEISKANLHLVPPDYIRKQTLVNGERYITEELKAKENEVLGAEEKRVELEYRIFTEIVKKISSENRRIKAAAGLVAQIDVLAGLAAIAEKNGYTCPEVNNGMELELLGSRHPVIEQTVKAEDFVPNDITLETEKQKLLIITGPNMAGKSTILRQTALAVVLAQMGGFVPASKAVVGIVDRIFTRVGASDDITRGESTFMIEMNETANILRHATPRSLVILDEIGRGTSTYDGLSIAWAVAEALHDREGKGVRTLFATHYHEMIELVNTKQRAKNFNIAVREWNKRIIFLRKLVPGGTSRSYGIEVARIAGLPEGVILRAKEILENLESNELNQGVRVDVRKNESKSGERGEIQLGLFAAPDRRLREWVLGLDIHSMTPLDALVELNRIREYLEEKASE